MVDKIDPKELFLNSLPIPTDWTNSLSYLEMTSLLIEKVNSLITAINTLSNTVTNQATSISNLRLAVTTLQNKVASIENDIENLDGDIDANIADINTLKTKVQNLNDFRVEDEIKILANKQHIGGDPYDMSKGSLDNRVSAIETAIGMPYTAWQPLQTRVNNMSTEVGTLTAAKNSLNSAVGMPYENASSISARLDALES